MAGLKDIAAASGVSVRTVNRALKGNGYVGKDTRDRVLRAARELGYRPNRLARSLRMRRSFEVAVVAWSTDELHMARIAVLEQRLRPAELSVTVLLGSRHGSTGDQQGLLGETLARRPAGVALFFPPGGDVDRWVESCQQQGIPCVLIDPPEKMPASVRIDRQQGVYEAVLYLAQRGRSRIAYLGGQKDTTRLEGYHRAMSELGREPIYLDVTSVSDQTQAGRYAAELFLEMSPRPDGIQAYSDVMAMSLLAGLHEHAVRVPEDVAVVGFDDRQAASLAWPALTTVAQPNAGIGRAVADMLLETMPDPSVRLDEGICLPTRLVVRDST
jgi:DNA-binding LacI/PurR family transcriptional regulator